MRGLQEKGKRMELENLDKMYKGNVFIEGQVKKLAAKYNLRFLPSNKYCGNFPVEALAKIKEFSKETDTDISDASLLYNFYILAPAKCFKLDEMKKVWLDPDPAIFYKISKDKYRMIHQWGSDFTLKNLAAGFFWKSRTNFFLTLFAMCTILCYSMIHTFHMAWGWWFIDVAFLIAGLIISYNDDITDKLLFHEDKWNSFNKIVY